MIVLFHKVKIANVCTYFATTADVRVLELVTVDDKTPTR